jgi:dihydrolipoamide dehydrogenase
MADKFDVVVLGGGPGGYVAAIRSAQLGLRTASIDRFTGKDGKPALGGTCLNVGCIPSKALLDSSKNYHHVEHEFADHGISVKGVSMDIAKMLARKDSIVRKLTSGVSQMFKGNKVEHFHGTGRLLRKGQVELKPADGAPARVIEADHIILASGSVPIELPKVPFDGKFIVDNVGALDFSAVPGRLGVIGAGVIGLELGSVWSRLGSEVVLLEALEQFLPVADQSISQQAAREFARQGLKMHLGTLVKSASVVGKEVLVTLEDKKGESQMTFDRLLVAVGRKPFTEGLLAAGSGVRLTGRGQIEVDEQSRTSVPGVWAIGDCVRGPMLAHKASEEGIAVAELIAGKPAHIHFDTVPWVVYTDPEIAWVGKTEQELKEAGVKYRVGSFPYAANGRALAGGHSAGLVKMLADSETDEILGIHIFGVSASELIAECVVAMEFHGSSEDLARIIHAHPTLSEAVHEAALHVDGRAIHRGN